MAWWGLKLVSYSHVSITLIPRKALKPVRFQRLEEGSSSVAAVFTEEQTPLARVGFFSLPWGKGPSHFVCVNCLDPNLERNLSPRSVPSFHCLLIMDQELRTMWKLQFKKYPLEWSIAASNSINCLGICALFDEGHFRKEEASLWIS